jgi:transposase InsO family protein
MQILSFPKTFYKLYAYTQRQEALDQHRKKYQEPVFQWEKLKSEGVCDATASEFSGISRATYYRYKQRLNALNQGVLPPSKTPKTTPRVTKKTPEVVSKILTLRRDNPTYGKAKIAVILKRDHAMNVSESTTGRILKSLMNQGKITKSLSALRPKRKRVFKKHARPWLYGMKPAAPGHLIQIDHMTVSKNGITIKHFQMYDHVTKTILAEVYSNANSRSAKKFLRKIKEELPFAIVSIQVDGGSEFMADFEEDCQALGIALFVLPPKKPQYNGGVERGNRIFKEEFYARAAYDSLGHCRALLKTAVHKYNTYRPHYALKGSTPSAYTKTILLKDAA